MVRLFDTRGSLCALLTVSLAIGAPSRIVAESPSPSETPLPSPTPHRLFARECGAILIEAMQKLTEKEESLDVEREKGNFNECRSSIASVLGAIETDPESAVARATNESFLELGLPPRLSVCLASLGDDLLTKGCIESLLRYGGELERRSVPDRTLRRRG